jgi:hypothetical protein
MYEDAYRVVQETLAVDKQGKSATNRLPEKGEVDFVPYDKIDLLHNLVKLSISKGLYNNHPEQKSRLQKLVKDLEGTVTRHFKLLNLAETGLTSARTLRNGGTTKGIRNTFV